MCVVWVCVSGGKRVRKRESVCVQVLMEATGGCQILWDWSSGGCEPHDEDAVYWSGYLQEQLVLLTVEPFFPS